MPEAFRERPYAHLPANLSTCLLFSLNYYLFDHNKLKFIQYFDDND